MYNEKKNTVEYTYLHEAKSVWVFSDLHCADWQDNQP